MPKSPKSLSPRTGAPGSGRARARSLECRQLKALSGSAARTYFRAMFASVPGLGPDAARRLTDLCAREIAQVRVRRPLPIRTKAEREAAAVAVTVAAPAPAEAGPPASAFDPYAFSLIVVLRREGREALLRRLENIGSTADLKILAEAQHIAVKPGAETLDELRAALIAGAQERIADRLAAAS